MSEQNEQPVDEVTREFLVESQEGLDKLDRDFVALEADPTAADRIASIFRTVHTIKGTSGFLGFGHLGALTHAGESLLSLLRDGATTLTPEMTSVLLALVDRVRATLRNIENTGQEGPETHDDLLRRFAAIRTDRPAPVATTSIPPKVVVPVAPPPPAVPVAAVAPPIALTPVAELAPAAAPKVVAGEAAPTTAIADSNVRVDIVLLDKLMNLVGELVLARNQILQFGEKVQDLGFVGASQRLNLITTELQEHVMKTRMQPIGNVWAKLPRVVRDLAVACGKQVRIEMLGKETELDRTILEAIKDPLTHIVRNAVDHGLESPDDRAARGKPRTGTLVLRAYHEGGQVNIEISDDGAGLNVDAIRIKAIERNLVTSERAARLSDHELMQLVFLPGFSTAEKVTNVSGRGVGMDVVKTNIERIGGTVDLISQRGTGTTLKIRIPLTLAIVPALVVSSAGQRYAIPQVNLLELVRLEGEQVKKAVETIHGAPVYRLRGQLLPLVYLSRTLNLVANDDSARSFTDANGEQIVNIIVLKADDRQFGLVVDEVKDTEEIVVKPLGKELKGISVFAGATIMGDGKVALILDVLGLAQHAGAVTRTRETAGPTTRGATELSKKVVGEERQALLLFGVGPEAVMGIPLSMVARIEEFPRSRMETAGNRRVVQYRGEILPLTELSQTASASSTGSVHVIVYSEGGRSVGFVVDRILDVVEDVIRIEKCTSQPGILGAAVIQGRVTDLLDVQGVLREQAPWFFERAAA
jgi:two-component system chemotaxis sensor kinase CheA